MDSSEALIKNFYRLSRDDIPFLIDRKACENRILPFFKEKRMGSPTDIRKGSVIMYNGAPHVVMNLMHRTPGRRLGFVQTTMRNLETGSSAVAKFFSNNNVDFCDTTMKNLEFSYIDGSDYHFIDPESFDDIVLSKDTVGDDAKWLIEGTCYSILYVNGEPVSVQLPLNMTVLVKEAAEGLKGDSATNATKAVTLENGVVVQVPLFIKQGEKIKIRTEDETYIGRA